MRIRLFSSARWGRVLAVALIGITARAQDSPPATTSAPGSSPIQWSGTTRLYGQSSNRQGTDQGLPASFARWDLSSVVTAYGIPFSVNALVSSERSYDSRRINYFNIGFSRHDLEQQIRDKLGSRIGRLEQLAQRVEESGVEAIRDSLRQYDPGALKLTEDLPNLDTFKELYNLKDSDLQERMGDLQKFGLASALQSFTSFFPTLVLGSTFPSYSPLTLGGVQVNGVDLEFTPGIFYSAFSGGKVSESTPGFGSFLSLMDKTLYSRSLFAGRLGVGQKDDSHFYLTGLYARDDAGSMRRDSANQSLTPMSNYVYGSEGRLLLFDDRFFIAGEAAVSVATNDVEAEPADSNIPSWLQGLSSYNMTSSYDYAFSFQSGYAFVESGTKLSAQVRRIGPGYTSLGVPYLRKDYMRYEGRIDQSLLNRQIILSSYYRRDEDNLESTKDGQTTVSAFGAQLGLNFRNYPYLRINYAPMSQQSRRTSDSLKIENDITVLSVLSGYGFRVGGVTSSTSLSFIFQEGKTLSGIGAYRSRNASLFQNVGFSFPLFLSAGVGVTETQIENAIGTVFTVDLSGSYTFFSVWENSIGVSLARDAVQRTGFIFSSSVPLWNVATLIVNLERVMFDDPAFSQSNYNETLFRMTLAKSW